MEVQDLFVGIVAICCGVVCLIAALLNLEWSFRFWAARMIETRFGRAAARLFYGLLGIFLIAIGSAISSGGRLPIIDAPADEANARTPLFDAGPSTTRHLVTQAKQLA